MCDLVGFDYLNDPSGKKNSTRYDSLKACSHRAQAKEKEKIFITARCLFFHQLKIVLFIFSLFAPAFTWCEPTSFRSGSTHLLILNHLHIIQIQEIESLIFP